ncbi:TPA: endonuclease/exonuclease/phosphatase family protein [Acinetobacter baumannii]|nr:endonuclease/exonuclease/phosphatase family protein [Acinetobacter baumannii]
MNQSLFVNINLSPPIGNRWNKSKVDKKIKVSRVIQGLLKLDFDFLCLCEVSPEDMEFIDNSIQLIGMGYDYNIYRKNYGGLYFDTCVIFKNTFDFVQSKVEVDGEEKNKLKVFQKYEFLSGHLEERIIFYVTHWLSQLNDNKEKRRTVASFIKKDTNDEKKFFNKTKFVVLGDFNVEPYDSAILEGLRSTRDQKVISNNSSLFYNPFWKFLQIKEDQPSGTHHCTKNEFHHWHIYDQILVSGNFFRDGWNLDDNLVLVFDDKMISSLHNDSFSNPSDHLPICLKLEKTKCI